MVLLELLLEQLFTRKRNSGATKHETYPQNNYEPFSSLSSLWGAYLVFFPHCECLLADDLPTERHPTDERRWIDVLPADWSCCPRPPHVPSHICADPWPSPPCRRPASSTKQQEPCSLPSLLDWKKPEKQSHTQNALLFTCELQKVAFVGS